MPTGIFQYSKFQGLKLRAIVPHTGRLRKPVSRLKIGGRISPLFLASSLLLRFRVLKYKSIILLRGRFRFE